MGGYLAQQHSGFNAIITDATNKASELTEYPILPFLVDQLAPRRQLIRTISPRYASLFSVLCMPWSESLGIHAHAAIGHSLGEITTAVIARAFSFEVGLQFKVIRIG